MRQSAAALLLVLAAGCGANSPPPIDRPAMRLVLQFVRSHGEG